MEGIGAPFSIGVPLPAGELHQNMRFTAVMWLPQ